MPSALVGSKEKQLVFADRSPQGESKLILPENRAGLTIQFAEVVICVQTFVAEELKGGAVEGVATTSCDHINIRAGIAAVGCVVLAGLHLEFLDGVGIRDGNTAAEKPALLNVVDLHPIHLEIIVASRSAVGHEWRIAG